MIRFVDFKRHIKPFKEELEKTFNDFLEKGWYVLGEELRKFESEFASYCECKYGIGVASGTDALFLALSSLGIDKGDEVITVPNTAIPTVAAIVQSGATPCFTDISEDTYTMDPSLLEKAITPKTKAIIPVHLYGQTADMDVILSIAKKHSIPVIEDCAQAHGALFKNKKAGCFGLMGCFSFYPTKNLGCFGDGGMIVTNDKNLYDKLISIRNYGQKDRYTAEVSGFNSRLDEIQASFLRVKLKYLEKWNQRRNEISRKYNALLNIEGCKVPTVGKNRKHVYHLYVIQCNNRDKVQEYCKNQNVQTLIHYPVPIHLQPAYSSLGYKKGDFPITENVCKRILSLPIYPELTDSEVNQVTTVLKNAIKNLE